MTVFPTGAPTNARSTSESTPSLSVVSDLSVEPEASVEPVTAPAPEEQKHDYGQHDVRVEDQGSFTVARCTCGWRSYARRSRDLARREGNDHALLYSPEA